MFDQNNAGAGQYNFGGAMSGPMTMPNNYYHPVQQPQKISNLLTEEEIRELQKNDNKFTLGLTNLEAMKSACTHRQVNGLQDSLSYDSNTGIARCAICGYEFMPLDYRTNYEEIKAMCDNLQNVLQTIKLLWPDIPANAREFFQIIALIDKIPQLFEFAAKNFNKNEFDLWNQSYSSMAGMNLLNNLGNILGAQQMAFGGPQPQPQMGYAPGFAPQPNPTMYNPQAAGAPVGAVAPGAGMMNPFGYDGASVAPAPVAPQQGYAYVPTQTAAPVQPSVPTPNAAPVQPTAPAVDANKAAETTVTQTVTV